MKVPSMALFIHWMDKTGRLICEQTYQYVYYFNTDGYALAEKYDGSWVYVDTNGEEIGDCSDPDHEQNVFNSLSPSHTDGDM